MEMGSGGAPQDVLWFGVAAVPIIIALVALLKTVGMPSKFAPLAAVAWGLIGAVFFHLSGEMNHTIYQALMGGLLAGLGAAGLYSGAKAMTKPTDPQPPGP